MRVNFNPSLTNNYRQNKSNQKQAAFGVHYISPKVTDLAWLSAKLAEAFPEMPAKELAQKAAEKKGIIEQIKTVVSAGDTNIDLAIRPDMDTFYNCQTIGLNPGPAAQVHRPLPTSALTIGTRCHAIGTKGYTKGKEVSGGNSHRELSVAQLTPDIVEELKEEVGKYRKILEWL